MKNPTDLSTLIDEAKDFEARMQSKMSEGKANDFVDAETLVIFDEMFAIDNEKDAEVIREQMKLILNRPGLGYFCDPYHYESSKRIGWLKYSDDEISAGSWEEEDLQKVKAELYKQRIDAYFRRVANSYEQTGPIKDSIVRLDQEEQIVTELRNGFPVLVRGTWRTGKSSMLLAIERNFPDHAVVDINIPTAVDRNSSPEAFAQSLGLRGVAKCIVERESTGLDYKQSWDAEEIVLTAITTSGKPPLAYLNDYLAEKGGNALVCIDEAVAIGNEPEKLRVIAELKDLDRLKVAVVLHKLHPFEEAFSEAFVDFKTHYLRPLNEEEVGLLVRRSLQGTPIEFTEEALQEICDYTGGRPMEVHNLCRALMDPISKISRQRVTFRLGDIKSITDLDIWALDYAFEVAEHAYQKIYEVALSPDEKAVINRLIVDGKTHVSQVAPDVALSLAETGLIKLADTGDNYEVNGVLLQRVLTEVIQNRM